MEALFEPPAVLRRVATTRMPTRWGTFDALAFERADRGSVDSALALVLGDLAGRAPLLRILARGFAGDTSAALRAIGAESRGLVIREHQPARDLRLPAAILRHLRVGRVRLLSDDPRQALALLDAGIEVLARLPRAAAAELELR